MKPKNWRTYSGWYRPPSYRVHVKNPHAAVQYAAWLCETRGWSPSEARRYCDEISEPKHGRNTYHLRRAMEQLSKAEQDEEKFLARAEGNIRAASTKAVTAIVKIGFELTLVKAKVGHGKYTAFVTDRLGWSMQAALNFSRVFEMTKSTNFVDLETLTIDASSLYLIAAPSTPEAARGAVLEQAATPAGVSHNETKRIVDAAKGKPPAIDGAKPHWDNQLPAAPVAGPRITVVEPDPEDMARLTRASEAWTAPSTVQFATAEPKAAPAPAAVETVDVEQYRALVIAWDGADVSVRERFLAESMDEIIAASSEPIIKLVCVREGGCNRKPECADIFSCRTQYDAHMAEPPIAAIEPEPLACTRPKGCGYASCKTEGICLHKKAADERAEALKPRIFRPDDAYLARMEAEREAREAAQPPCQYRTGICCRGSDCTTAGRCLAPGPTKPSAEPEIDLAKAAPPSKALN